MSEKEKNSESFEFKAEVRQLLDILVHSLYSSREIFLRELLSNANDALDKLRLAALTDQSLATGDIPYEIRIDADKENSVLTISDTGIGMTRDELINNIGTIAKSGTSEFIKQLKENQGDTGNLIGRFGVGFYSVFMVASKVTITSLSYKPDAEAIRWSSDGLGAYQLEPVSEEVKPGTSIRIELKEDAKEFADKEEIKRTIKTHSNFINFPIYLEEERVNTVNAIWKRSKSEIKEEEYAEFYKFLAHDTQPPLETIHINIDAPIQFNALLFIPQRNFDFFGMNRDQRGLDLYVRKVLIQHENKELIPEFLGFVKGVVDSEDIPLNISRETLQENANFNKIAKTITSQILKHLLVIAKDKPDTFKTFWKEHGRIFKLGYADFEHKQNFMDLLRFNASFEENEENLVSLEDYKAKMLEGQKEIYYIYASSRAALAKNPFLDSFKAKGLPVIYVYDNLDEFVLSNLFGYKDLSIKSVSSVKESDLEKFPDINSTAKEGVTPLTAEEEVIIDKILVKWKETLAEKVSEVVPSKMLRESPVCLTGDDNGMSAQMIKLLRMQNKDFPAPVKKLEINKDHKLIREMVQIFKKDENDALLTKYYEQLFLTAMLFEGDLEESYKLAEKSYELMTDAAGWYLKGINDSLN